MSQRERILEVLNAHESLTQKELSYHMYGNYDHAYSISTALMKLVETGTVTMIDGRPRRFALVGAHTSDVPSLENEEEGLNPNAQNNLNVILLNKPFLGGWLNKEGNIGHEIIDFLLTDKGEHYAYNNPFGVCPDDIWVAGTEGLKRKRKEKYLAKYLVLTSEERGKDFDILYVIELEEKLHRLHAKKNINLLRSNQQAVQLIIKGRDIKYNGKYLHDIYQNDGTLYLTFKASLIYRAVSSISITGLTYNFQRNKGYLYSDEFPNDYDKLKTKIEDSIADGSLELFTPRNVSPTQISGLNQNKTFINLTKQEDSEQIFTNILHSVLEQGDLLNRFCDKFRNGKTFNSHEVFKVSRETRVVEGRMDVCAESANQRVIIENKINSGLNGVRPDDNETQLSTYYNWGKQKSTEPLCFVVAPNYRRTEITREIREKDPNMEAVYTIVTYGDIAKFIENEYNAGNIPTTYAYYSLVPQIIDAFKNHSYPTKEDLYAGMFLDATN